MAASEALEAPELLWVLMVTSAVNCSYRGDVAISDLDQAGLPTASIVQLAKIATIEARDVEWIGSLPVADRSEVTIALRDSLAQVMIGIG